MKLQSEGRRPFCVVLLLMILMSAQGLARGPAKVPHGISRRCLLAATSRLTVLLVSHEATLTGAPIGLYQLVEELARCSAAVTLLSLKSGAENGNLPNAQGIIQSNSSSDIDALAYDIILVNTLAAQSADFVHQQVAQHGPSILRRIVWWEQELKNIDLPDRATLELLSEVAEAVFSSKASYEYFQQAVHDTFQTTIPSPRFHVVPLALGKGWLKGDCTDLTHRRERRLAARSALNLDTEAYIVLSVGQIIPQKGILELVQTAGIIRQNMVKDHVMKAVQPDIKIVLAGPTIFPDYQKLVETHIAKENLEGMVRIMKAELDPRQFYEAADVFVMNSVCENFARVVLEAMAMHLPVLGTSCGGTVEQVKDGVTGYLHSFGDAERLASNIIRLSLHSTTGAEEVVAMGSAGCERVHRTYSVDKTFKQWDRILTGRA